MDVNYSPFEILTGTGALFLCLLFVCIFSEASSIEDELATEAAGAVAAGSGADRLFWSSVEAQGQHMLLSGAAPNSEARQHAGERAAEVFGVGSVTNEIAVIGETGTCQQAFDRLLAKERVTFKSGRADLSEGSLPLLGALAAAVRQCGVRVELAVHTDAEGDSTINLKLSQRRADTVRHYLASSGVATELLVARGYGETQPIADNRTTKGREANRRVEVRVLGSAS